MEVGHNALEVEMAGMGYTNGSCCGDKVGHGALPARAIEGRIRERGGDSLSGEGVWMTVPKRRKGGRGSGIEMRAWDRELTGCREKGEVHSTRGQLVRHDVATMREWGANGPNTDGVRRARSEMTRHA